MKVFLTKNMDKRNDFVNGMEATIESYDCSIRSVTVLTMSPDEVLFSRLKGSPRRGSSRKNFVWEEVYPAAAADPDTVADPAQTCKTNDAAEGSIRRGLSPPAAAAPSTLHD